MKRRLGGRLVLWGAAAALFQLLSARDCLYHGLYNAPDALLLVVLNLASAGTALGMFLGVKYRSYLERLRSRLPFALGAEILLAHVLTAHASSFGGLTLPIEIAAALPVFLTLGAAFVLDAPEAPTAFLLSLCVGTAAGFLAFERAAVHLPFAAASAALAALLVAAAAGRAAPRSAAAFVLGAAAFAAASLPRSDGGVVERRFTPYGVVEATADGNIDIDGRATRVGTHIARKGDMSRVEDTAQVPYRIRRPRSVLVIGVGGGQDVAAALHYGAGSVTGIEINPDLVDLMRGPLAARSNGLLLDPRVRIVVDEGRHALRYSEERYDLVVVQRPWTRYVYDKFVHTPSDFLVTPDALKAYSERLTPNGMVFLALPTGVDDEDCPLLSGLTAPADRVFVRRMTVQNQFRQPAPKGMCVFLASKKPFTGEERRALAALGGKSLAPPPVRVLLRLPGADDADHPAWDPALTPWLIVFVAAMAAAWFAVSREIRPAPTSFPAPVYVALGVAYFWLEAVLLRRAMFFLGDIRAAYECVICSFTLFGGAGYLHAARSRRDWPPLAAILAAAALLAADARWSVMWDRTPGRALERVIVVLFCGAVGYLCAFPFGTLMAREESPANGYAWDGLGLFFAYPAMSYVAGLGPGLLVYGAVGLYAGVAGWMLLRRGPVNRPMAAARRV